jgi:plasmid maintenance system antidote protein VapI
MKREQSGVHTLLHTRKVAGRPTSALRLVKFFGITPDFWMNLQLRWDLYFAEKSETKLIESIQTYKHHANIGS